MGISNSLIGQFRLFLVISATESAAECEYPAFLTDLNIK